MDGLTWLILLKRGRIDLGLSDPIWLTLALNESILIRHSRSRDCHCATNLTGTLALVFLMG